MTDPIATTARPYTHDEVCALAERLLDPLGTLPDVVAMAMLLLQLVVLLERHGDEDHPPQVTRFLEAADPLLKLLFRTARDGPYDGLPVA